jgi:rhodanese-related sulfurtransferase
MRPIDNWLGVELIVDERSTEEAMQSLAQKHCETETCATQLVGRFHQLANHKAIALPLDGTGFGYSYGGSTTLLAGLRAIKECNLRRNRPPTLCELRWINQSSLQAIHQMANDQLAQASQSLKLPELAFYGNEEYGRGEPVTSLVKTEKKTDMTPLRIDGIQTIATRDLVERMQSHTPPVMVDVLGAFQSLPGAQSLVNAGFMGESESVNHQVQTRFEALLTLLAPDRAKAVVFFGASRDSWQAVNAAIRARQMGYETVFWYRGGIDAWKAARLPTALNRVQAVVH